MATDLIARGMAKKALNGDAVDTKDVKVTSSDDSPAFLEDKIKGTDKQIDVNSDGVKLTVSLNQSVLDKLDSTGASSDGKVKINDTDDTADYLTSKLLGSENVSITPDDEQHVILLDLSENALNKLNSASSSGKVNVDAEDEQDYLENKIVGTTGKISVTKNEADTSNKLVISVGADLFDKKSDSSNVIVFNNTSSTLSATHVGDALTELDGKVETNKSDIASVQNTVDSLSTANGKVKLNVDDTADYVESKIDGTTIKAEDGKLVVKTLDGLSVDVATINYLQGTSSNIQDQINSFTQAFHLLGAKDTKADLDAVTDMSVGDSWIVNADESNDDAKDWYTYSDAGWILMGLVEVTVRDFSTDPIDLNSEVTGTLDQGKIDLTGLVKTSDLSSYMDKESYDSDNNGVVNDSDKFAGHTPAYYQDAKNINVDTTNFSKNLSDSENTIQLALNKLDQLEVSGGTGGSTDLTNYYSKDQVDTLVFQASNKAKNTFVNLIGDSSLTNENTFDELSNAGTTAKIDISTALTNKGIEANSYDSLESYANKINQIVQNMTIKNTKLNRAAGSTYSVVLTQESEFPNVVTTAYEHLGGETGVVKYDCNFDNSDSASFDNVDTVTFDGTMKQQPNVMQSPIVETMPLANGTEYSFEIDKTKFNTIDRIFVHDDSDKTYLLEIDGTHFPVFVIANDDIDLSGVENITKVEWTGSSGLYSKLLLLFSLDSGVTWHSYDITNKKVVDVDTANNADIEAKGLTVDSVNNLSAEDLITIRNKSPKIRFGYYFNVGEVSDDVYNDKLALTVDMVGNIVFSKNVDVSLGEDHETLTYTFNKAGTYTIVYVDSSEEGAS